MGAPRSGGERGRLGLAVAARGVRAVGRNRIRRRLRAAFAETAAPTDWDFVVRARKEAGTISFQLLVRDLGRAVAAVTRKGFR
jgi:ribonuclease P protein component